MRRQCKTQGQSYEKKKKKSTKPKELVFISDISMRATHIANGAHLSSRAM